MVEYYILGDQYPSQNQFIDGNVCFYPELPWYGGYYKNCNGDFPDKINIKVKMDKMISKLKVNFFKTTCGAFFASKEFCDVLRLYNSDVQYVNIEVSYSNGEVLDKKYYLLHSKRDLDCFDYYKSDYGGKALIHKEIESGGKPKRMIKVLRKLCIDYSKVENQDFFFVENTLLLKPVISSRLKESLEKANLIIDILEFDDFLE